MVSACHSIARWLTQAGRLVAILYDSISPHRVRRDHQRHWREQGQSRLLARFSFWARPLRSSGGLSWIIRRDFELGDFA
jgi:hypothetical protein